MRQRHALQKVLWKTMKYKTKQQRLVAITDAYCKKFNKTSFTMTEVSMWALATGLYPCPKRGDSEAECLAWEEKLAQGMATR
jgi:hypothetical protein